MPGSQQRATGPYVQTNQLTLPPPTISILRSILILSCPRCRQEVKMCQERVTSNGKAFISISVADQRDAVRALKPGQSSRLSALLCNSELAVRDGPLSDPPTQSWQRTVLWHWHAGWPAATEAPVFAFQERYSSSLHCYWPSPHRQSQPQRLRLYASCTARERANPKNSHSPSYRPFVSSWPVKQKGVAQRLTMLISRYETSG